METVLFKIVDICQSNRVERTFIQELHHNGLIQIIVEKEQEYIHEEQIPQLERFISLHYDLDVNIQGIEVVHNLLQRIEQLQQQVELLKKM